jgi:hypothetical protein
MQHNIIHQESDIFLLKINFDYEKEILPDYALEIKKISLSKEKKYSIQGFRPGKLPMEVAKEHFGPVVLENISKEKFQCEAQKIVNDMGYTHFYCPYNAFIYLDGSVEPSQLVVTVAIQPIYSYKEILKNQILNIPSIHISDLDIDNFIEQNRLSLQHVSPLLQDELPKAGDIVTIMVIKTNNYFFLSNNCFRIMIGYCNYLPENMSSQLLKSKAGELIEYSDENMGYVTYYIVKIDRCTKTLTDVELQQIFRCSEDLRGHAKKILIDKVKKISHNYIVEQIINSINTNFSIISNFSLNQAVNSYDAKKISKQNSILYFVNNLIPNEEKDFITLANEIQENFLKEIGYIEESMKKEDVIKQKYFYCAMKFSSKAMQSKEINMTLAQLEREYRFLQNNYYNSP